MEGTGTSATAMLVATPEDVGGRPDAATVTLAREEIEEALASDQPLDLILTVDRGTSSPQDVRVSWERSDLETVLSGTDTGGITLSFDRAELNRALEQEDFEGHGIREMVMITVAAAGASAALAASTASAQLLDTAGGGGATSVTAVQPGDPGTIPYLSQGIGVDQSQFQGEASTAGTQASPERSRTSARGSASTRASSRAKRRPPARRPSPERSRTSARGSASTRASSRAKRRPPARRPSPERSRTSARGSASTRASSRANATRPAIHDEATLIARGVDPAIATAMASHGEAATASELAAVAAIHDESTLAARGVDQIVPGADEATLAARGIHTPAVHDEGTLVTRGIESPAVPADSGTSFEMPALDSGTAAAIGGLAGAGLLIVGAAFVARRRTTPAA